MSHSIDIQSAPIDRVVSALTQRLDTERLTQNVSQASLAQTAGVSRRTVIRMAAGEGVSLESYVRVALALGLTDALSTLLTPPELRPLEQLTRKPARQRASRGSTDDTVAWHWGDENAP
ncbi:MAG: helix-turn-helix transcriptional regulator [Pseudomonadota bacterium]